MKIVVTGGSGFLGQRLIRALCDRGQLRRSETMAPITHIVAFDSAAAPEPVSDPRLQYMHGDMALPGAMAAAITPDTVSVFHLAAVVSGAAEADLDLGLRVNIDGTRALLDACRVLPSAPTLVFASSVAVFGGPLPDVVEDSTMPTPQSSYGVQKLVGELLVGDYSRRGHIDGRSVRLPTIVVRPGKPNAAASSFASSVIREPLAGIDAVCPVPAETPLWVLSPTQAVASLIHAHETSAAAWSGQPALSLPGLTVSVREMVDALRQIGGDRAAVRVRFERDERIARIVGSWPARFNARRALALGFTADPDIATIVRAYAEETSACR